ncbi:unnamed protein product [Laminaria digitata]
MLVKSLYLLGYAAAPFEIRAWSTFLPFDAGMRKYLCRMTLKRYLVQAKAARKTIEYLSATAHLGLTFRMASTPKDVQLVYELETYVDADYAHKADYRRSVSGVAVCCGGTFASWFSRTQKCVTPSTCKRRST